MLQRKPIGLRISTFVPEMRYFLQIAYDGTNYHGWQIQPNAVTVQEVIVRRLQQILPSETIEIMGCGRTDTGVHASKFFAHFDTVAKIDETHVVHALNKILPEDIAVHGLFLVAADAHARFDATTRTYIYRIHKLKDPFLQKHSMLFHRPLDVGRINEACGLLLSHTDFSCFSRSGTDTKTNDCDVMQAVWRTTENGWVFEITANRFLRNMVRAIVGTLLEVGMETISVEDFRNVVESKNRSEAGTSAPACGLCLVNVTYPYL